jgi:hypothetical protein
MCDVADLAGVPENSLSRIVEMTGMAGFLQQPQPGHVAHTAVSAPFVTKPSLLDAALFISEVAAPSALSMAAATQNYGVSQRPNETAYNIAFHTPTAFANACEQRPRLQRQWPAYLRFGTGNFEASMIDILSQYDWSSLGSATVIEVSPSLTSFLFLTVDTLTHHPPALDIGRCIIYDYSNRASGALSIATLCSPNERSWG